MKGDRLIDVREAAAALGISPGYARSLLRSGELIGVRHPGRTGWRLQRDYVRLVAARRARQRRRA